MHTLQVKRWEIPNPFYSGRSDRGQNPAGMGAAARISCRDSVRGSLPGNAARPGRHAGEPVFSNGKCLFEVHDLRLGPGRPVHEKAVVIPLFAPAGVFCVCRCLHGAVTGCPAKGRTVFFPRKYAAGSFQEPAAGISFCHALSRLSYIRAKQKSGCCPEQDSVSGKSFGAVFPERIFRLSGRPYRESAKTRRRARSIRRNSLCAAGGGDAVILLRIPFSPWPGRVHSPVPSVRSPGGPSPCHPADAWAGHARKVSGSAKESWVSRSAQRRNRI